MKKKTKLIRRIFPAFLVIIALSLSSVGFYATRYLKDFFLESSEKELLIRSSLLRDQFHEIFRAGSPDMHHRIDEQCKRIGNRTGTRVTVILPTGAVIGDSFGDTDRMENHMTRPEIASALKGGQGIAIRYSATLDKTMMYAALPVIENESVTAVVRTALSISVVDEKIRVVRNSIALATVLAMLIAAIVSLFLSRYITRPIEGMKKDAAEFAKGHLNRRMAVPDTEELADLAFVMNQMAQNLDEKINAFENRSRELEAVHASMQEGVIAIDTDERIITINQAAAKIFGFTPAELKNRYILEAARNVQFQKFIGKALKTHSPVEEDITIFGDEDMILNIHSSALFDSSSIRIGTLIIFHDITRIRRLEKMHKDFAANASHELKTPLTSIMGFIETLQGMLMAGNIEEAEIFLGIIEKNVNRMVALINDLLALSKIECLQGTQALFEPQSLTPLISGAINFCSAGTRTKNITFHMDCPEDLTIMADPLLMEQAIINILDNAVKYSPENETITITGAANGAYAEITVQDKGCGIAAEHLPHIFNRFYRVDKSRSRVDGGTGLGLSIVKHIVQYHHGRIDVQSTRNKGAIFKISIPKAVA